MRPDDGGWRLRAWRYVFESRWFNVRQDDVTLPGGLEIQYHSVEHPRWVMVVPVLDDGRVVMERVYRWPLKAWTLECPSGGCDGEPSEAAARRELEEETGYRAGALVHLGDFAATNGHSDERFDVYLATDVREGGELRREPTEQIEVELIPLAELRDAALRGELPDAPTSLALLLAAGRPELTIQSRPNCR